MTSVIVVYDRMQRITKWVSAGSETAKAKLSYPDVVELLIENDLVPLVRLNA